MTIDEIAALRDEACRDGPADDLSSVPIAAITKLEDNDGDR